MTDEWEIFENFQTLLYCIILSKKKCCNILFMGLVTLYQNWRLSAKIVLQNYIFSIFRICG